MSFRNVDQQTLSLSNGDMFGWGVHGYSTVRFQTLERPKLSISIFLPIFNSSRDGHQVKNCKMFGRVRVENVAIDLLRKKASTRSQAGLRVHVVEGKETKLERADF